MKFITTTNSHCCYQIFFLLFFFIARLLSNLAIALDTITSIQPLTQNQTISSAGDVFELGFFNPPDSSKWYVGVWYKNTPERTIVWVANRDSPLKNSSGILTIGGDGNIVILDQDQNPIWSTNQSRAPNTVAQLLDSGNFVLRYEQDFNPQNYLWQGFDHPTDTLLPGMKLGWDAKSGINRQITSWKSANDPSSGENRFVLGINSSFPECYLMKHETIRYRSGPWNGLGFSGVPEMKPLSVMSFTFVKSPDEISYSFQLHNRSLYSRLVVNYSGDLQRYTWIDIAKTWNLFWYAPKDQCDYFKECGDFGICDTNHSPVCICMKGFQPKNPQAWSLRDGSGGCVRVHELDCKGDGFLEKQDMKLPGSFDVFVDHSLTLEDCKKLCLQNCSCMGYSNSNISGSGCAIWSNKLVDLRQYAATDGGQTLYVRVAASDSDIPVDVDSNDASKKKKRSAMVIGITVGSVALLIFLSLYFVWRKKLFSSQINKIDNKVSLDRSQTTLLNNVVIPSKRESSAEITTDDLELPLFDFTAISSATNHFSDTNKLGQGGFGSVYKGFLVEGQEVAVKRLSKNSGQGTEEFKNEVRLIAKLQHRNLVRLIGCCVDMEEKMLIYEYMVNKSLDSILFNKGKSSLLNWQRRFNIICGIARGLLYLHQDSRFRIIHRDLKASNILLDKEMNPKISDFGMARMFSADQIDANTKRVVGTYGYMAPEYAMDGVFSEKSDVFSFGVLVLEIVSGTKNRGFYHVHNQLNLLAYAWRLWKEGRGAELRDPAAGKMQSPDEVLRCIQVGLLCVQEQAEERPNMATVVLMLSSGSAQLPQPKQPGFSLGRRPHETDSSSSKVEDSSCTVNQVTVTIMDGR